MLLLASIVLECEVPWAKTVFFGLNVDLQLYTIFMMNYEPFISVANPVLINSKHPQKCPHAEFEPSIVMCPIEVGPANLSLA